MTFIKLLEKQRVQNLFASYEKYIGHFFYKSKLTVALTLGQTYLMKI